MKSPKLYLRDIGILHALTDIESFDHLLAHPSVGASWEGYALENVIAMAPRWRPSFVRTSNGAEVDLVLERGERTRLFEFKASKAPKASRGFHELTRSFPHDGAFLIAPVDDAYPYADGVDVMGLRQFASRQANMSRLSCPAGAA